MKKQILIDYSETLIRLALLSEGVLTHLYIEDPLNQNMQNRMIQGQISDVVKNLKAVFVDFGQEKKGLLHLSQIPDVYKTRIHVGLRLPVQIVKENKGEKGHKLTAFITIPGQYFICLPFEQGIGISKQITNKKVRENLKTWLEERSQGKYGFVVRTQAQEVPLEVLEKELEVLIQRTDSIMQIKDNVSKETLLLEEEPFYIQMMREYISLKDEVEVICNEESYIKNIENHFKTLYESLTFDVTFKQYKVTENIFSLYSIEKDYEETLKQKIWLKNGGNIMIDYTEAMTVMDVNSAKAVQKKNNAKTVWELNTLAVQEAVKQMMLRNLGGIILIDLVEFQDKEQKEAFNVFIREYINQVDGKRSISYPLTELGLLQIARTKKYMPLYQKIFEPCSGCGSSYSTYTVVYRSFLIEQKIKQTALHTIHKMLYVKCNFLCADFLIKEKLLEKFEKRYGIKVELIKDEKCQYFEILHHV